MNRIISAWIQVANVIIDRDEQYVRQHWFTEFCLIKCRLFSLTHRRPLHPSSNVTIFLTTYNILWAYTITLNRLIILNNDFKWIDKNDKIIFVALLDMLLTYNTLEKILFLIRHKRAKYKENESLLLCNMLQL